MKLCLYTKQLTAFQQQEITQNKQKTKMRIYQQQAFRGIPSNQPLKSPSPDLKGKNSIGPTMSPHNLNISKAFSQYTPPNRAKKPSYMEYSTLPLNSQTYESVNPMQAINIDKMFEASSQKQKQYSSTHAKGHYNFQVPRQSHSALSYKLPNENDLISTGKKSHHQNYAHQQHEYRPQPTNLSHLSSSPHRPNLSSNAKQNQQDLLNKTIAQKDLIISQLKSMINLMTENGKHLKKSQRTLVQEEYEAMKGEVKILTIENQKLSEIIDKLTDRNERLLSKVEHNQTITSQPHSKSKNNQSNDQATPLLAQYQQKLTTYQQTITSLQSQLQQKQSTYQKEIDQLIKSHKSLAVECKMYETEKERYSKENQRLINLLRLKEKEKETCYANYSYVDKAQYDTANQQEMQTSGKNPSESAKTEQNSSNGSNNRLSLQKIKQQYEQNLKQYKQNVYNEVYNMFDSLNSTLQDINQKINLQDGRLSEIERFVKTTLLSRPSKVTSHLTSMEENDDEIKKSAIYIEEAPSSERISNSEVKSRQALSIILEESRRDNEKLETELSQMRNQVQHNKESTRQKAQSQDARQRHLQSAYSQEEIKSYQEKIKELQALVDQLREEKQISERQLIKLECEILKAEQNRLTEQKQANREKAIKGESDRIQDAKLIEDLKAEIFLLKQQVESRNQLQGGLRQSLKELQERQDTRKKQLLNEIQRLNVEILEIKKDKQRGLIYNGSVIENLENQVVKLSSERDKLSQVFDEKIKVFQVEFGQLRQAYRLLNEQNDRKSACIIDLEKARLSWNGQRLYLLEQSEQLKNIRKTLKSLQLPSQIDDNLETIQTYISSIESQNTLLTQEKNELISTNQQIQSQTFQLNKIKIKLTQEVNTLTKKLQIYKKQLLKTREFYDTYLKKQNDEEQIGPQEIEQKVTQSQIRRLNKKENGRNKIRGIIEEERNKINSLMEVIDKLTFEESHKD